MTGSVIPESYWPMLAQIESSNNPLAKAASSSASGLYQLLKSSWLAEGGQWGSNPVKAFGGLHPPRDEQTARAKSFTLKNVAYLKHVGVPITKASLYAAHFLGVGTAARILAAPHDALASDYAGSAATAANPTVLKRKTVGQFLAWLNSKTEAA